MERHNVTDEAIRRFCQQLRSEEREPGTIEKYRRDVRAFAAWLQGREASKERVVEWKEHLRRSGYAPVTINSMLTAANRFFRFLGWDELRVRTLRIQRRVFRGRERELTR